ncbi:MAG: AEC family transporter [Oceanicaulis sp.]
MTGAILLGFLPVFAVIAIGYAVRASGLLPRPAWRGVNALNYRVLLPSLLFVTLARTDFAGADALALTGVSLAGMAGLILTGFLVVRLMTRDRAVTGAFVAVSSVWNIVLVLALATNIFGPEAAGTAIKVLVPGSLLATLAARYAVARAGGQVRLDGLATDPLVLSVLAGLVASFTPLDEISQVMRPLDIIAAGSMGVILLSIGAGLDFPALKGRYGVLAAAAGMRALASPLIFLAVGIAVGFSGQTLAVIVLAAASPTAAFIFALVAEFEGEEGLTAGMITASVLATAVAAPAFVALALSL